jgi:hypothetical protein
LFGCLVYLVGMRNQMNQRNSQTARILWKLKQHHTAQEEKPTPCLGVLTYCALYHLRGRSLRRETSSPRGQNHSSRRFHEGLAAAVNNIQQPGNFFTSKPLSERWRQGGNCETGREAQALQEGMAWSAINLFDKRTCEMPGENQSNVWSFAHRPCAIDGQGSEPLR